MVKGERPTVDGVRKALHRGSPNHIATCMQRFSKDQAALNAGDPIALTRLPPQLADAAVAQWERALRLAQQTAKYEGNAARAHLDQLRRDTGLRSHSFDLREKEWDLAALADAREHVNVLLKELAADRAELRARDARIADLESQLEDFRRQLATVIARAIRIRAFLLPIRRGARLCGGSLAMWGRSIDSCAKSWENTLGAAARSSRNIDPHDQGG